MIHLITSFSFICDKLYFTFIKPILDDFENIDFLFSKGRVFANSEVLGILVYTEHANFDVNLDFHPLRKWTGQCYSQEKHQNVEKSCYKILVRAYKSFSLAPLVIMTPR